MHAIYNITNDRLCVWFDDRLSAEQYEKARSLKFQWWPGRKCFSAVWSPSAEDFICSFGIAIEQDDTPDDVAARVERFAQRAEKTEAEAESTKRYLEERANTERRIRLAEGKLERTQSEAEHWQRRIDGAIRHAAHKERPEVIGRRILGLEADERYWQMRGVPPSGEATEYEGEKAFWVGHSRGGWWVKESAFPAMNRNAWRWLAHIADRLEYERASYEAAGGSLEDLHPERAKPRKCVAVVDKDGNAPEVGGACAFAMWGTPTAADWVLITKANKRTCEILRSEQYLNAQGDTKTRYLVRKVDVHGYKFKSAAQVNKELPELAKMWTDFNELKAKIKARKQSAAAAEAAA